MAGLIGAVVAGLLCQLVTIDTADGARMSLIVMTARIVRANHAPAGWLIVLVYGVVVGALFGRLVRDRTLTAGIAMVAGAFYGVGWWIGSGLITGASRAWPGAPVAGRRGSDAARGPLDDDRQRLVWRRVGRCVARHREATPKPAPCDTAHEPSRLIERPSAAPM